MYIALGDDQPSKDALSRRQPASQHQLNRIHDRLHVGSELVVTGGDDRHEQIGILVAIHRKMVTRPDSTPFEMQVVLVDRRIVLPQLTGKHALKRRPGVRDVPGMYLALTRCDNDCHLRHNVPPDSRIGQRLDATE